MKFTILIHSRLYLDPALALKQPLGTETRTEFVSYITNSAARCNCISIILRELHVLPVYFLSQFKEIILIFKIIYCLASTGIKYLSVPACALKFAGDSLFKVFSMHYGNMRFVIVPDFWIAYMIHTNESCVFITS